MTTADELVEPVPVMDIYCDGIGAVDNLGENFRMTFFVWGRDDPRGPMRRLVAAKLIRPKTSILRPNGVVFQWLSQQPAAPEHRDPFQGMGRPAH